MTKQRNALKAGLFIVFSVAAMIFVVISIKGASRLLGPRQLHTVRFKLSDDLGGLRVGDDVRVGGFKVGAVQAVELVDAGNGDRELQVEFTMPRKYELRDGSRLGIQTGLTGTSALNFDSLGKGKALPDDVALAGSPDPKSVLFAALGGAGSRIDNIMRKVDDETVPGANKLLAHLDSKVDPLEGKVNTVADRTSEAMAQARDLIGDTKGDFRSSMKNITAATDSLQKSLPELLSRMNTVLAKVDGAMNNIQGALDDANKTMANARDLTASAKAVVVGNRSKFDSMVAGLKVTADNLKAASAEVRRSPWRLLYKPGPNEMANLNLYDSARQFSEGATAMSDASAALRDALKSGDASPEDVKKLVDQLDTSFAGFKKVEDKLWASVREE